jgi:hypothetical protein
MRKPTSNHRAKEGFHWQDWLAMQATEQYYQPNLLPEIFELISLDYSYVILLYDELGQH